MLEETDLIYTQVESFIKGIHEKNLKLNDKAQAVMMDKIVGKDAWGKAIKEKRSLADLIGDEIFAYQAIQNSAYIAKSMEKDLSRVQQIDWNSAIGKRRSDVASSLLKYIEQAYSHDAIDDIGLAKKLQNALEENETLKKQKANLQKLNNDLARKTSDFIT